MRVSAVARVGAEVKDLGIGKAGVEVSPVVGAGMEAEILADAGGGDFEVANAEVGAGAVARAGVEMGVWIYGV